MNSKRITIVLLALFFIFPVHVFAQFSVLETKNLRLVYYGEANSYLVKYAARCFENSLDFHKKLYNYDLTEKITVFIHDLNDYGNAGAGTVPKNHITIAIAPLNYVYETSPVNERINTEMNHELVHIVTLDQSSGADDFFRDIFQGKVVEYQDNPLTILYSYLTTPRRNSPRWYREGIAVFLETWMAGGLGRLFSGYDEMVFRTIVNSNGHIYDMVGLESEGTKIDFHVGVNSYLYGTRFMSYLAAKYGPEKLIEWTSRHNESHGYFVSQFEKVYGIDIENAWNDWISEEYKFQKSNINLIEIYPTTYIRHISNKELGSLSQPFYSKTENVIYTAVNYPGQVPHIASININNGEITKLCNIKGAALFYVTHLTFDPESNTLFFTTDNNDWRDLMSYDISTGKTEQLLEEARIGDLAFSPSDKSIWGIRHFNGRSTLVRIPKPYSEWNQIYSWPYGRDMYDISISHDGKYVTGALAEISGRQLLIRMEIDKLLNDDHTFEVLYDFENSLPANFIYSSDDRYLYGASYYTGVSNIWRYSFESEEMETLSNCKTGLFRPIEYTSDSLLAFNYSPKGFIPAVIPNTPLKKVKAINFLGQEIVEKHPIVEKWKAGRPSDINIDSLITYEGNYNGLSNIGLSSAFPIVEGYKEFVSYGAQLNFSDHLGLHNIILSGSYSPNNLLKKNERLHLGLEYSIYGWTLSSTLNRANFYDLFGPTKISRKGYSIGLNYKKSLLFDKPKTMGYNLNVSWYGNLERLPDYQNVNASFDKLLNLNFKFYYQDLRASLGAIDYENGYKWDLTFYNNYVNSKNIPRIYSNFDFGIPLPINHSSIWLRSSIGYSSAKRTEPFANFYFGGFGNNWVDKNHEKQYRNYFSFPGKELNSIGGTNFGKLLLEWNLPPIRFRHFGFTDFYVTWARPAVFASSIITNLDSKSLQQNYFNVGGQIDIKFIFLSHLKTTLSFGYAAAFNKNNEVSKEFMISLKIL